MHQESLPEITQLLDLWDQGTKSNRADILKLFVAECKGKTAPELEGIFSRAASLFLTRLTAWLRLTYPFVEFDSSMCNESMLELCMLCQISLVWSSMKSNGKIVLLSSNDWCSVKLCYSKTKPSQLAVKGLKNVHPYLSQ